MTQDYVCALIAPEGRMVYAFLPEPENLPKIGSREAIRTGSWAFPTLNLFEGEEPNEGLSRLLRDRLSINYSIVRSLTPRESGEKRFFPFVCAPRGGENFSLRLYLACKLDEAEKLLKLPWEAPFDKMLEEFSALAG